MYNYLEWSNEYKLEAEKMLDVINKIKENAAKQSNTNKKELYEKIQKYRGYYRECMDIANLLEKRHRGEM